MGISLKNSQWAEPFNGTTLTITGLTSGRVPYITTGGLFTDSTALTFTTGTGNLAATLFNELTLTKASVGFTVAGGTTSKTLTVSGDATVDQSVAVASSPTFAGLTVSNLTAGRIPIAGTAGLLGDDADLTFSGDTLTATKLVGTTSVTSDSVVAGSTTDGGTLTVNSTIGSELITAPMDASGWTLGTDGTGGWGIAAGVLSKTTSAGTQTATAVAGMTSAPTAGVKYQVVAVVSAASGTTAWTLGGTTIPSFSAAGTYTYTVTAGTTAKLIFSGVAATTCTITSVSVKAISTADGNAEVINDLTVGRVLARMGSAGYPSISFTNDTNTGFYGNGADRLFVIVGGTEHSSFGAGYYYAPSIIYVGSTSNVLVREIDNATSFRNSTNQQVFRLYNTYTDTSNYERLTLTGVAGASVNLTAETAGTGGDNLDIVLTPAGTGRIDLPNGTYHTYLKTSTAEGLAGADFRIGLDETNRTLIICDSGDIATDFGLTAQSNPAVYIYGASVSSALILTNNTIKSTATGGLSITGNEGVSIQGRASDLSAGNWVTINSGSSIELTDTDGRQAWLYVEPKVNQSGTAAFDGIYVNPTLTAVGTGATGDGNNLLNLSVASSPKFKVDTSGKAFSISYSGSLAADAVGSTGLTALYGLLIVKDTTTGQTAVIRMENTTITFISAGAIFNAAKDNAATVNIYYETDQVKIQNKTAGEVAVAAGFYGL